MIAEDYCSYEVAKLLKEKGFDELCFRLIREDGDIVEAPSQTWNGMTKKQKAQFYLCPTHQMAMKWLRQEKNIIINVWYNGVDWNAEYYNNEDKNFYLIADCLSNSYEEAVEVALKYCLENLI